MSAAKLFRVLLGVAFIIISCISFYGTGIAILMGTLGLSGHISETISHLGWSSIFFILSCTGIYVAIRLFKKPFSITTAILMVVALIPVFMFFIEPMLSVKTYEVQQQNTPYSMAVKYFCDGDYGLALENLKKANRPTGSKPYEELITAYVKNRDFDDALKVCNEYNAGPNKLRAGVYFWRGDYESAINEYQSIAKSTEEKMEPPDYTLYISMANCYAKLGNDARTLETFDKAIEISKQQYRPSAIGMLNQQNIESYGKPDVSAIIYKGDFYLWKGQYENAMTEYNKAIEINPDSSFNRTSYIHRAFLFTVMNDYNSALNELNKLIDREPGSTASEWCKRERAYVYDRLGLHEKAGEDLKAYNQCTSKSTGNLWGEVDKIRKIPPIIEVFKDVENNKE